MRILIVEDQPALGKLLKQNLEAEAYAVDLECDGERGLQLAKTNEYDVIVLDDILPGKRGFEICRELRAAGQTMPILFMSVQGGVHKKVDSLNIGADDYLAKPFSYVELSARIRALLRRSKTIQPEALRVGDLVLDVTTTSAIYGGKTIYLTTKEYALLRYLMANAGQLVTRAMIFEHVWDEETDMFSNMIDTHIYNLRRKIGDSGLKGGKKVIHTISGRGYIMM